MAQKDKKEIVSQTVASDKKIIDQINNLHARFEIAYKSTTKIAVNIGELLLDQKSQLKHGQWGRWVRDNLKFTERTASNYIRIYKNKDKFDLETDGICGALSTLKSPDTKDRDQRRTETRKFREAFADLELPFTNPPIGKYENEIIAGDNCNVMAEMIKHGMAGKIAATVASPNYNSGFFYSSEFDDSKPVEDYFDEIAKPFEYYSKLLKKGGRVIYIIGNYIPNKNRDKGGDYNYDIPYELRKRVEKIAPNLRYYGNLIWNKGEVGKNPLNNSYGTFCSPEGPVPRACHEQVLIWSKDSFTLENTNNVAPDITKEEFKALSWSVWNYSPQTFKNNPHPCSYNHKLAESLIKYFTYPQDWILESYNGSGVGCKAAKNLNRKFTGIDLNKSYCAFAKELIKADGYQVSKKDMQELLKDHEDMWKYLK